MKRILTFLFLSLSVYLQAQQSKPIHFREETFDFGTVKEDGGSVLHEFVFTNTSNRPVRIVTVQASCGCTTPDWSKDAVQPGKTGFVQASYNPKGRPGFFNKSLTVTTDFDANPIILQIKGNVTADGRPSDSDFVVAKGALKFSASAFNMGKVYLRDEPGVRDFQFFNASSGPVTVNDIVGPEHIKAEVTPKTIKPGEKGHVKVSYFGKKKNLYGFHSDNIELHTDDVTEPVKSFSVYATLEDSFENLKPEDIAKGPRLQLAATSMDFGRVGKNATVVREISVTNTGKSELAIKAVQGNCTCVTASAAKQKLKPGESATISVSFNSTERKGTQQKAVTVYSNDPTNPVQRFTFTAYIQE